ncbi:DUF6873 family GME fold protein [Clostridium thermarum]|uniref:DUF6873 family GME fold protein n=1 Tax=Clostridium thermarum TaxID=1716543 RepID=UPI001121100D|nr:hypothetical protein [Clostridium thermarum]
MNCCIVDCRISESESLALSKLGLTALLCPRHSNLYAAISSHPDIQIFVHNKKHLIVQKKLDPLFINQFLELGIEVTLSEAELTSEYPHDIILNCFRLGDLFVHNLKYTDNKILEALDSTTKKIHVKQGYTKCSTAIVNEGAVITNDIGIAKALTTEKIDVLYLPHGDIVLEEMNYGFIGGCCGLLDEKNIAFFGSLDKYIYGKEIKDFLRKHKVEYHYLMDEKLTDRGSLLMIY